MKKILAVILTLSLVLGFVGSAMADRLHFSIVTSDTTSFTVYPISGELKGNHWFIRLDEAQSNLSPTHRAVVRLYQGSTPISSTYVYSGPDETEHLHTYQAGGVPASFRARLDSRDSGVLEFHGTLYHSYGH